MIATTATKQLPFCFLTTQGKRGPDIPLLGRRIIAGGRGTHADFVFVCRAAGEFGPRGLFVVLCFLLLWTSCAHTHKEKTSFEERRGGTESVRRTWEPSSFAASCCHCIQRSPLLSRHFFFICSTEPISDLSFSPPPPRKHLLPFCTTSRHLPSRVLWPALYIVIHK